MRWIWPRTTFALQCNKKKFGWGSKAKSEYLRCIFVPKRELEIGT